MKYLFALLLLQFIVSCKPKQQQPVSFNFEGKPRIPVYIKAEHDSLLGFIKTISLYADSTGKTGMKLTKLLEHHFAEEEDYVFPALGLLPELASGKMPTGSKQIIAMIERYRSNSVHLMAEHQVIAAYLDELNFAAASEGHDIKVFSTYLHRHATEEEQVYFPSVILVEEFLKCKLPS